MEPFIENQFQHQSQPSNSRLLRFRSAPSSLLSGLKEFDFIESPAADSDEPTPAFDGDGKVVEASQNGYSGFGQNPLPPQYPKPGQVMEGPFVAAMGQSTPPKLTRQSSSPAGFMAHLNGQNGYGMMGGIGSFRAAGPPNGLATSIGHLPRIPEIGAEATKESSPDGGTGGHGHMYKNGEEDAGFYNNPGFSFASWSDPATSGPKAIDKNLYSGLDASTSQNGGFPHRAHALQHHVSLPKTSAEIEKLLNFQDIVPCKTRAKRGCATHPRSIAERVRRTRISDRMRKLQELVPNMDKQVNTSDMLDFAVEYIKDLQKQHKKLSDCRARCKCPHAQQSAITILTNEQ